MYIIYHINRIIKKIIYHFNRCENRIWYKQQQVMTLKSPLLELKIYDGEIAASSTKTDGKTG
jgi:hypothetical protein